MQHPTAAAPCHLKCTTMQRLSVSKVAMHNEQEYDKDAAPAREGGRGAGDPRPPTHASTNVRQSQTIDRKREKPRNRMYAPVPPAGCAQNRRLLSYLRISTYARRKKSTRTRLANGDAAPVCTGTHRASARTQTENLSRHAWRRPQSRQTIT